MNHKTGTGSTNKCWLLELCCYVTPSVRRPLPLTKKSHTGSLCPVEHFLHGAHLSTAYTPCNQDVCILASSIPLLHGVPSTASMHSCFRQTFRSGMSELIGEWPTHAASVRAEKYLARGISFKPLWESLEATLTGLCSSHTPQLLQGDKQLCSPDRLSLSNGLLCLHSSSTSLSLGPASTKKPLVSL